MLPQWEAVVDKIREYHALAKENSDYVGTITDYLEVT